MKLLLLIVSILSITFNAYATPDRETGDYQAVPKVAYGKTSGGTVTAILVDSSGIVQTK